MTKEVYSNTLETLYCLREIGVLFNFKDLTKNQNSSRWPHIDYKQELIDFFKQLEVKKHYANLNKQLKPKNNDTNIFTKI